MDKDSLDSLNTSFSVKDQSIVQFSVGTSILGRALLAVSDEDLRNPIHADFKPQDWSLLKISDEDIREQNQTMESTGQNLGIPMEQGSNYGIASIEIVSENQNNCRVPTQNVIERRIVGILGISDEDIRNPIHADFKPQDWSGLRISDEDLR